ncbi:MAG TPA: sugar phosphate isomerase/epimerase [Clostridia bacterium]|nr:sugar phosphate isomerase/epimerase [Clostridia bacterium]
MTYGLQLYSIRDITPSDLDGALAKVAAIGYKFVEFAGFFGHPAEEVAAMLKKHGLTVSGTHTGWTEVAEHFEETVAYHKTIGNKNIIVPGADLKTKAKLDAFIDMANHFQPLLEKEGIAFHYHNHAHEFHPNEDGQIIYDELVARTKLFLEIDTFWAYAGGRDPIAMMDALADRVKVIHIKDGTQAGKGMPLGQGTAPVKAVWEKAKALGIPMVVESETLTPSGIEEAEVCFKYLSSLS